MNDLNQIRLMLHTFLKTCRNIFIPMMVCSIYISGPVPAIPAEKEDVSQSVHINVGYVIDSFSGIPLEESRIAVKILFDSRFRKKYPDCKGDVTLFPDIQSAIDAVHRKQINGLGMTTLDYLITKKDNHLVPVRNAKMGDGARTRFVLLVKKDRFLSLDRLRNKTMIINAGGHGNVACMWMNTLLLKRSFPESGRFFRSVDRMDKMSQAVMKVFFGKADACIVQKNIFLTMNELNPQIGSDLQILYESPEYLMGVFVIAKGVDEKTRKIMIDFIDDLVNDKEGDKILSMFRVRGISEFKQEYMESIENLYQTYLNLKLTGK